MVSNRSGSLPKHDEIREPMLPTIGGLHSRGGIVGARLGHHKANWVSLFTTLEPCPRMGTCIRIGVAPFVRTGEVPSEGMSSWLLPECSGVAFPPSDFGR